MSQDSIKKYYLLCTVRLGKKAHIINNIQSLDSGMSDIIFTKKEIDLFLRRVDGQYIAREVIVGGRRDEGGRAPIVIIGP